MPPFKTFIIMKKIFMTLFMCASLVSVYAHTDGDYEKVDIFIKQLVKKSLSRSVDLPLESHVNLEDNCLVTNFTADFGEVIITVKYLESEFEISEAADSSTGWHTMNLPADSGCFEVIYEFASGNVYSGSFQL